jgi:uncharacterized protein (DUF736 family)
MAIIGTFTKTDTGFEGQLSTLTLKTKLTITAIERINEKAPDFRIFAGATEIGAAWSSTTKDNKPYLSVKLDDPSFPASIMARLVSNDQGHALIWNR